MGRDSLGKGMSATDEHPGTGDDPLDQSVRPSLADLDALSEPVFPADAVLSSEWLDTGAALGPSLADHPLLRGLLLELPPKGAAPGPDWLDRWFDAARSILELLYMQEYQHR